MYEAKVLEPGKKNVVSREEMEQLLSTAERLSDGLARARASQSTAAIMGIVVLVGILSGLISLLGSIMFQNTQPKDVQSIFFISVIFIIFATALFIAVITIKRLSFHRKRISLLRDSLESIMNMLEEARHYYDQDLSPIEHATLKIRLQTITFS